jgi:exopolysaccharide production protein ExoY
VPPLEVPPPARRWSLRSGSDGVEESANQLSLRLVFRVLGQRGWGGFELFEQAEKQFGAQAPVGSALALDDTLELAPQPSISHASVEPATVDVADLAPHSPPELRITTPWGRFVKRSFDLLLGVPMFLFAIPIILLLIVLVRTTSRGPALFTQTRVGRNGRPFRVYKFRSMQVDAEQRLIERPALFHEYRSNGYKLPPSRDPRVTKVGRFLRRTSLDELPQVLNVLFGSMSLVGPRPVLDRELNDLYDGNPELYLATKPGLTGLWQVSGRSNLVRAQRVQLDDHYVLAWSPWFDARLLLRTVPAVVTGNGAC